jgi:murein DD-endopeptidase MepM/ murein hydrolase activator NlpD
LSPGDRVSLPTQAFYEVKKKDTLYSISRSHKTDVATLAKLNGLSKPFTISVGQRLQIPGLKPAQPAVVQTSRPATKPTKMPSAPKRVGRFLVPVKGAIISSFGPKDGGLHNDGINIAAREGAPIRAAENGVVVYTGNELRGYGNLLLIRHSGGWVTAYAHTSKFLVKPGAQVKQGDVVAEVGRTGNVDRPQLHFELRKGTRAVNPQSLI